MTESHSKLTRPVTSALALGRLALWGALTLGGLATLSCSSDKGKGGGDPSPCANELASNATCGAKCQVDKDCAGGNSFLYCGADKACTSDCTAAGGQCSGTCRSNGSCDGVLIADIPKVSAGNGNESPIITNPNAPSTGGSDTLQACATGNASAKLSNVTMYIMFDQSRSMADNRKWENASSALTTFLKDPGTDGLNIALRFFPSNLPVEGCVDESAGTAQSCEPRLCEKPLIDAGLVKAAANDTQEKLLVDAIAATSPGSGVANSGAKNRSGGTPISAALGGAILWAENYQATKTDQKAVVIFVTDGEPNGCDESQNAIANIAAEGRKQGVDTYSIGLEGSAPALMKAIAQSGGTDEPYMISTGDAAAKSLLDALNQIRGKSLACDFEVPKANTGTLDPNKVNVTLTSGGTDSDLFKVDGEASCKDQAAWYYDSNSAPKRMFLCPSACKEVTSRDDVSLKVVFGCVTNTKPVIQN